MQNDFEVLPRGTTTEITLSRELARVIEDIMHQYGPGIVPESVRRAYEKLHTHYVRQIHEGTL